jgi:hypothetical protein
MNKFTPLCLLLSVLSLNTYADQPNMGDGRPHFPPKEAIDACSGKAVTDACSFTGPGGNAMEGSCRQGPDGKGVLACAPKPPKEALDACTGKTEGNDCSFVGRNNNNITGVCRKAPNGEAEIACVPNFGMHRPEEQNGGQPGMPRPGDQNGGQGEMK